MVILGSPSSPPESPEFLCRVFPGNTCRVPGQKRNLARRRTRTASCTTSTSGHPVSRRCRKQIDPQLRELLRHIRVVVVPALHVPDIGVLVNYDRYWQKFAQRLRAAGKPGSVVAAAVANRWIRRLYHEMKTPS